MKLFAPTPAPASTKKRSLDDDRITNDLTILHNKGHLLAETGHIDEALALYEQILQRDPDRAQSRANLVRLLMKQGRSDDALAHTDVLVQQGYGPGVVFKARMMYRLGRYPEAIDLCELLITSYDMPSDDDRFTVWYVYAKALYQAGREDEARHAQKHLELLMHPSSEPEKADVPTMFAHVRLASDAQGE